MSFTVSSHLIDYDYHFHCSLVSSVYAFYIRLGLVSNWVSNCVFLCVCLFQIGWSNWFMIEVSQNMFNPVAWMALSQIRYLSPLLVFVYICHHIYPKTQGNTRNTHGKFTRKKNQKKKPSGYYPIVCNSIISKINWCLH